LRVHGAELLASRAQLRDERQGPAEASRVQQVLRRNQGDEEDEGGYKSTGKRERERGRARESERFTGVGRGCIGSLSLLNMHTLHSSSLRFAPPAPGCTNVVLHLKAVAAVPELPQVRRGHAHARRFEVEQPLQLPRVALSGRARVRRGCKGGGLYPATGQCAA
jgi:hypothetical protein